MNTALYSLSNDDGVNKVDVVLFRGSALAGSGSAGISDESAFYMITKISTALDEDGMSCKKIYFGTDGKLLADSIRVIDIGGTHSNLSPTDPIVTGLKPGYVVQYGLDKDGKIGAIRVISDFNKETGDVTHQYNYANYTKGTKCAAGVITQNSPAHSAITIDAWNEDEGGYLGRVSGKIYIYHSADDKLVEASQAELVVGDKITAHIKTYHSLTEIFVIR